VTRRRLPVSDARRPVVTWEQRRFPKGWSAPQAAELAGVPARTVQTWRKEGFFVPALPGIATGHPDGVLYSLGDVVALRMMRRLLDAGADREVVARVGEEARFWDGEHYWALREVAVAEPPWWYLAPMYRELLPDGELTPIWLADQLDARLRDEPEVHRESGLVWLGRDPPCAVWLPFSELCGEMCGRADSWRRRRRISPKQWPGWM
jgi:MerR HTH family regulatory protein